MNKLKTTAVVALVLASLVALFVEGAKCGRAYFEYRQAYKDYSDALDGSITKMKEMNREMEDAHSRTLEMDRQMEDILKEVGK